MVKAIPYSEAHPHSKWAKAMKGRKRKHQARHFGTCDEPNCTGYGGTPFPERAVSLTLTGAQWFALLAKVTGRDLSAEGVQQFNAAAVSIKAQLLKEQV